MPSELEKNTEQAVAKKKSFLGRWIYRFAAEHAFKPATIKITIVVAIVALLLFVSAGIGRTTWLDGKTTTLGLKNMGELTTQAAFFTEVQTMENARDIWGITVPFTQSSYVYSYDGIIRAGLDFAKINTKVNELKHQIIIELPEVKILSISIDEDSLKVYTEEKSIYTPLTVEMMNASIAELKKEAEKTSIENGLLENAQENAKVLIEGYLSSLYDMQVYSVVYK